MEPNSDHTLLVEDAELGEISWKIVDQYYKNMSSPDAQTRRMANNWLIKFQVSEHSMKIAEELLEYGDQANQLLAISILEQKINSFSGCIDESLTVELSRVCNLEKVGKTAGIVKERLCISIAKIAIYQRDIADFVAKIITYGSEDTDKCMASLIILANIPLELEFLGGSRGIREQKKSQLLMKCHDVYDYLILVLNSQGMDDKMIENGFKSIEAWVVKSDKFYSHVAVQELVFETVKTKWYKNAMDIMLQVINKSSNAKLFESTSFEQAFQCIQEPEKRFLDSVLNLCLEGKEQFDSEIDDTESEFCKELANLFCELLSNFEIILFADQERATRVFEMVFSVLRHSSRNISLRGLEFFGDLKDTLNEIKTSVEQADYILEPFFTGSRIALEKSKRFLIQQTEDGRFEDVEESEIEGQETIVRYRDYSADLFFNTYYLSEAMKRPEWKEHFQQLLLEFFQRNDKSDEDFAKSMEVALFAAKSTIDAVELPDDKLIHVIWNAILECKGFNEPTVFFSAMGFMGEGAAYLQYNKDILPDTIQYIMDGFNMYHSMPMIQTAVFNCLLEIGQHGASCFSEEAFEIYLSFIEQNASLIDIENCARAMEGICSLCTVVDADKIPTVMHRIVKSSTDIFPDIEFSEPNHRIVFIKSLLMLCGAIKILSRFGTQEIKETLKPILDTFLEKIGEALQYYNEDKEVYLTICSFYSRCIKALGPDFSGYFERVATDCFRCFSTNKDNTKCIEVCCLAITLVGGTIEVIGFLKSNFDSLASCILQKMESELDYELIKSFAEFCCMTIKKISATPIMSCPELKTIIMLFCNFIMTTVESDAITEIIFFLHNLVLYGFTPAANDEALMNQNPELRSQLEEYVQYIGTAFIVAIPNIRSVVSQTFGKCLLKLFKEYPQMMENCIDTAFKNPKFSDVSEKVKRVFLKCLLGFREHAKQFKLTIVDFQAVMRGSASEDAFIGRELKLKELADSNDIEVVAL